MSQFTNGSRPTFLNITALNENQVFIAKDGEERRGEERRGEEKTEKGMGGGEEGGELFRVGKTQCFPGIISAWSAWKQAIGPNEPERPLQPMDSVQESRQ